MPAPVDGPLMVRVDDAESAQAMHGWYDRDSLQLRPEPAAKVSHSAIVTS